MVKTARTLMISLVVSVGLLVGAASPASATSSTLAVEQPWHYWISVVLVLAVIGVLFLALPLGYYFKVWRLKHRGR